ncbi:hypothetical protein SAMN05216304_109204 [Bosea sp. OK403]|uniref:hypothetical protein n=1 Tax=Bosea sp. OK403 TaxID=1855286 RepID=UPI0008EEDA46|nr:hypothetical protein [Bosea sp. OK403]SFJ56335.1 hypothetical protein SAMN05216304_109204 [Bosea sp. OK403]
MLEAIIGQALRFLWSVISEIICFHTGKALVQGLTVGRLAVADYLETKKPFALYWRVGPQLVLDSSIAGLVGGAFWIALFISAIHLLR